MRILMLSEPGYPRHTGGSVKCARQIATSLAGRGHEVLLACERQHEGGEEARSVVDGVGIHRLPVPATGLASRDRPRVQLEGFVSHLETHIDLSSLDVVYDTCGFFSYLFPLAYRLRQIRRVAVVTHFRYLLQQYLRAEFGESGKLDAFDGAYLALEERLHDSPQCFPTRISHRVICPSQSEAEFVERLYHPAPGSLVVVPEPVEQFAPSPESVAELRARLVSRPGEKLILFGGRISAEVKGARFVLGAVRKLISEGRAVRLVLPTNDEEEVQRFREKLGPAVVSPGWISDPAAMASLYQAVDVVVMPSKYESFGLMAVEAIVQGTAVVGARTGVLPELIRHGETGWLISADPKRTEAELVDGLKRLLDDDAGRREMGARARAEVGDKLALSSITDRIEEIFREAMASARETPRVQLPLLSEDDHQRYAETITRYAGADARYAAISVLANWPTTVEGALRGLHPEPHLQRHAGPRPAAAARLAGALALEAARARGRRADRVPQLSAGAPTKRRPRPNELLSQIRCHSRACRMSRRRSTAAPRMPSARST